MEVEAFTWVEAPEGMVALFANLSGVEIWDRAANTFSLNTDLKGWHGTDEGIAHRQAMIDGFNAGKRWMQSGGGEMI